MSDSDELDGGVVVGQLPTVTVPRHIKKRSLRNKALSVGFNDKDLRDFVTGFHKRKKKRRKEAQVQIQEKDRRKRIEARKKRKQERDSALYGDLPPEDEQQGSDSGPHEDVLNSNAVLSGTQMYELNDTTITVTTVELTREGDDDDDDDDDDIKKVRSITKLSNETGTKPILRVKKKPLKQAAKHKSRGKPRKPSSGKKDKKDKRRQNRK